MSSKHPKHHGRHRDRRPQRNHPAPMQTGRTGGGIVPRGRRRGQPAPVKWFLFGVIALLIGFVVYATRSGKDSNPITIAAHASNTPVRAVTEPPLPVLPVTQPEIEAPSPAPAGTMLAAVSSIPPLPPAFSPTLPTSQPAPAEPVSLPLPALPPMAQPEGPKIKFATPIYDFGRLKSGEVVKHDFVFTNIGTAPLEIRNVHVSCGCTTAGEWARLIQPGQTGSIPIQFHSANLAGPVAKSVTVLCNDTNQQMVYLQIKGTVWKPIDVMPQFAVVNVTAETPSNSVAVRIVNNMEEPITLSPPASSNPFFTAELKTNQPGKEFQLVIRTVPGETLVNAQGQISVKTSSTNMPLINVTTWANSQPVIMTIPSQINLPSTPLFNPTPYNVSIRNNGTNLLVLSDPTVNAQNVDVQLKELEPGKFYMATVVFPANFEIAPNERIELAIKSNHPRNPLLKVPIYKTQTVPPMGTVLTPIQSARSTNAPQAVQSR